MLKLIRWRCTYKCNYNCPMCEAAGNNLKEEKLNVDEYFKALMKYSPAVIDITGGEPLLRPGMIDLIAKLGNEGKTGLAITTNISVNLDVFVMKVKPDSFSSFVCSFHPEYTTERHFLNKLLMLKTRGFNPRVNFVPFPTDLAGTQYYVDFFAENGFKIHVDRYIPPEHKHYEYNDEEMKILNRFMNPNRKQALNERVNFIDKKVLCDAGVNVLNLTPDLDAYPCLTYEIKGIGKAGNLRDKAFSLPEKKIVCGFRKDCANCDIDHVSIREV